MKASGLAPYQFWIFVLSTPITLIGFVFTLSGGAELPTILGSLGIGGWSGPVLLHDLAGAQRQLTAAGACVAASIACDSPDPSVEFAHLAGSRYYSALRADSSAAGNGMVSPATQQSSFQSILCRGSLALIGAAGFAPAPLWHGGAHVRKLVGLRVHNS